MIDNSIGNVNSNPKKMEKKDIIKADFEILNNKNDTKSIENVNQEEKPEEIVWYNNVELKKFFSVFGNKHRRDMVFFYTLLGTGKRVSEVLALRRKDIDFENRLIKIITLKKRKKKIDTIRLHQDVAYQLSLHCGQLRADDKVFSFSRQNADKLCKKYAEKANIGYKRASCHNFRHTFAVRWLQQGKPIHKLQKHLGHSHITTTMVYLRIADQDYYETVDSLEMLDFQKD